MTAVIRLLLEVQLLCVRSEPTLANSDIPALPFARHFFLYIQVSVVILLHIPSSSVSI